MKTTSCFSIMAAIMLAMSLVIIPATIAQAVPTKGTITATQLPNNQIMLVVTGFADQKIGIMSYFVSYNDTTIKSGWKPLQTVNTDPCPSITFTGVPEHKYNFMVYAENNIGQKSPAATATCEAIPETDPPTLVTFTINHGTLYTKSITATAQIAAQDVSPITGMCMSSTTICKSWKPYVQTDSFPLHLSKEGDNGFNIWFRDKYGNTSGSFSATIKRDTKKPVGSPTYTESDGTGKALLDWSKVTDVNGIANFILATDKTCSGTPLYSGLGTSYPYDLPGVNSTLWLCATDVAGNTAVKKLAIPAKVQYPAKPIVTAGYGSVNISFVKLPASAKIDHYTATAYANGTASISTTGKTSPMMIEGLSGIIYTVTVTAVNKSGNGLESEQSDPVTPFAPTKPAAPTNPVAVAGDGQATVTVTPGLDGGNPITLYTATADHGNFTGTSTTPTIVVSGLNNGDSYTFTVTATNGIGTSDPSAPSNAVTPSQPPPTTLTVNGTAGPTVLVNGKRFVVTARDDKKGAKSDLYLSVFNEGSATATVIPILVTSEIDECLYMVSMNGFVYVLAVSGTPNPDVPERIIGAVWLFKIDATTLEIVGSNKYTDTSNLLALGCDPVNNVLYFAANDYNTNLGTIYQVNADLSVVNTLTDNWRDGYQFKGPILVATDGVYIVGTMPYSPSRISAWKYSLDLQTQLLAAIPYRYQQPGQPVIKTSDRPNGAILDGTTLYISGVINFNSDTPDNVWLRFDATSLNFIDANDLGPSTQSSYYNLVGDGAGNIYGLYENGELTSIAPATGEAVWQNKSPVGDYLSFDGKYLSLSSGAKVMFYDPNTGNNIK